jgi:anaerobic selenocysteine-containing dehydrogenase
VYGELPAACLAEEIETAGDGQVRALITIAGNPVLSTPNGTRLAAALTRLELMVSLDIFVNETTRHADVILPGLSPLEQSHYDIPLRMLAIRNVATYSPPVFDPPPTQQAEWRTLLRLTGIVRGGARTPMSALDEFVTSNASIRRSAHRPADLAATRPTSSPALAPARGPGDSSTTCARAHTATRRRPARWADAGGLEAQPHGIDFGPLAPRIPGCARRRGRSSSHRRRWWRRRTAARGAGARRHRHAADRPPRSALEQLWMHNVPVLVKGKARCTMFMHPSDAARVGLPTVRWRTSHRAPVRWTPVKVTDAMMPASSASHMGGDTTCRAFSSTWRRRTRA